MGLGIISFRPAADLEGDVQQIKEWCRLNGSTWNAVWNSLLPALAYAVQNQIFIGIDPDTGEAKRYIKADFGDVPLREYNDDWKQHLVQ